MSDDRVGPGVSQGAEKSERLKKIGGDTAEAMSVMSWDGRVAPCVTSCVLPSS